MFLILCMMDVIFDELRRNGVDIDKRTLSFYIKRLNRKHKQLFEEMTGRVGFNDLEEVFRMMNINNFGRAMTFLTLVYVLHEKWPTAPNVTRSAVRMVSESLRGMDFTEFKVEAGFLDRLMESLRGCLPI